MKMVTPEIKAFKRLYVATHRLFDEFDAKLDQGIADEQSIDLAIEQIDELINMLPLKFSTPSLEYPETCVLHVNIEDAEDEPEEEAKEYDGNTEYDVPENTHTFFERTIVTVLEDWKFLMWNHVAARTTDPMARKKYFPRMLAQATYCMSGFPEKSYWQEWEKKMFVLYANQIGWFIYLEEQAISIVEAALLIVEKGYQLSNWYDLRYIKDTKVRLLLKLGRPNEAYPIIREAFKIDPEYADFQDLKTDVHYVAWLHAVEGAGF